MMEQEMARMHMQQRQYEAARHRMGRQFARFQRMQRKAERAEQAARIAAGRMM